MYEVPLKEKLLDPYRVMVSFSSLLDIKGNRSPKGGTLISNFFILPLLLVWFFKFCHIHGYVLLSFTISWPNIPQTTWIFSISFNLNIIFWCTYYSVVCNTDFCCIIYFSLVDWDVKFNALAMVMKASCHHLFESSHYSNQIYNIVAF